MIHGPIYVRKEQQFVANKTEIMWHVIKMLVNVYEMNFRGDFMCICICEQGLLKVNTFNKINFPLTTFLFPGITSPTLHPAPRLLLLHCPFTFVLISVCSLLPSAPLPFSFSSSAQIKYTSEAILLQPTCSAMRQINKTFSANLHCYHF